MKIKISKRVIEFLKHNIWTTATVLIVAFMLYVIGHNVLHAIEIRYEISQLKRDQEQYQKEINRDSTLIENLRHDSYLERYARERYRMQRAGEEVFIFK